MEDKIYAQYSRNKILRKILSLPYKTLQSKILNNIRTSEPLVSNLTEFL